MATVVTCEALTVEYRRARWLPSSRGIVDVDLEVRSGEILGLLGPNGAGKTTLLRTLLDLLRPTSGRATVLGLDSHRDSVDVRRKLSYLPGEFVLPPRLTAREAIRLYTSARRDVDPARVDALAQRVELDLDRRVSELSKGNRQKVGLVLALAPDVGLLVLDEPTTGLDPLLQRDFRDLAREATGRGATVLLSSHVMDEVQHLADRVALMREGRVVDVDTVGSLRSRVAREIQVRLARPAESARLAELLAATPGVHSVQATDGLVSAEIAGSMDPLIKGLAGFDVELLDTVEPDLEDVFVSYYSAGAGSAGTGSAGAGSEG